MTEYNKFDSSDDQIKDKVEDIKVDAEAKLDDVADQASDAAADAQESVDEAGKAFQAKASELGEKLSEQFKAIDKVTPKEFGDMAVKFASDTAYAAAGFANLVAEKAKEFSEKQRDQRAPFADLDGEDGPADQGKQFIDQLNQHFNKFVEDLSATYKDLSERGRDTVSKMQAQAQAKAPKGDDAPGPFDIVDDAETAHDADKPSDNL